MNKETIDEYERMVKERDKLYILMLNTPKGSGARMMRDELYLLEANISKYMWYWSAPCDHQGRDNHR
jgi:hypothetical protein